MVDYGQVYNTRSQIRKLIESGIEVRANRSQSSLMHNKWAIIDHTVKINGSFNWSDQATMNNETLEIRVHDALTPGLFEESFEQMWCSRGERARLTVEIDFVDEQDKDNSRKSRKSYGL